jgi:phenylacetate-CoA ligase
LAQNADIARNLFGESRLPTLLQYDPLSRFFETTEEGTLLFSGDNSVPLIRYHIGDNGGIISYEEMREFLGNYDFDPVTELSSQGNRGIHPLPFVYVFGRSYFTVSYFGANIYPENVIVGLEQPSIRNWVTGKFVMEVKEDDDRNCFLAIVVELAPQISENEEMEKAIASSIHTQLLRLNSEFANYVPSEYQLPQITLLPIGDPEYFPVGVKHRYTRHK